MAKRHLEDYKKYFREEFQRKFIESKDYEKYLRYNPYRNSNCIPGCANCCYSISPYITASKASAISDEIEVNLEDFVEKSGDEEVLKLKLNEDGSCPFLYIENELRFCTIPNLKEKQDFCSVALYSIQDIGCVYSGLIESLEKRGVVDIRSLLASEWRKELKSGSYKLANWIKKAISIIEAANEDSPEYSGAFPPSTGCKEQPYQRRADVRAVC